jgi:hypothetical protein
MEMERTSEGRKGIRKTFVIYLTLISFSVKEEM